MTFMHYSVNTSQVYFATARELYEAFVLWSFYSMLLEFFPSRDALIAVCG
jgi:hypothetical protein